MLFVQQGVLFWEVKGLTPIYNLTVRIVCVLGAERGPADKAFEHDSTDGPPIACERVSLSAEDFRSDVVRGTNSRVGENSTIRFSPCLGNAPTIANGEIDLVKINGIPILLFARGCSLQEVLVVGVVVLRMESSRQTEVSELDMASTIKEDVVWLDVTG